jgi:hypothetical protein
MRYEPIVFDEQAQAALDRFRERVYEVLGVVEADMMPSRARSLCITKLDESMMWGHRAVEQSIARDNEGNDD